MRFLRDYQDDGLNRERARAADLLVRLRHVLDCDGLPNWRLIYEAQSVSERLERLSTARVQGGVMEQRVAQVTTACRFAIDDLYRRAFNYDECEEAEASPCNLCTGASKPHFDITFTDVTMCACVIRGDGFSYSTASGTIDGMTVRCTQVPLNPCVWGADIEGPTINRYPNATCAGAPVNSSSTARCILQKNSASTWRLTFNPFGTAFTGNMEYFSCIISDTTCLGPWSVANQHASCGDLGVTSVRGIAVGGTATITGSP